MVFGELFRNVNFPIIICRDDADLSLCFANQSACTLLSLAQEQMEAMLPLQVLLSLPEKDVQKLQAVLLQEGELRAHPSSIRPQGGGRVSLCLSANVLHMPGERFLKLVLDRRAGASFATTQGEILLAVTHAAHAAPTAQQGIEWILSVLGSAMGVDRLTLFERETEDTLTAGCEWCAQGQASHTAERQSVPRVRLYSCLMETELDGEEGARIFSAGDETVVAVSQEKHMLSLPIMPGELGYLVAEIGAKRGSFARGDSTLLGEIAALLSCFIARREQERQLQYHLDVLSTVSKHVDGMICVRDAQSRELLFANRALSEALSLPLDRLRMEQGMQLIDDMEALAKFPKQSEGKPVRGEFYHPESGKWYLAHRTKIKWIDGRDAQVDRMLDITEQKEHETALIHSASIDAMTGSYNRDWGHSKVVALQKAMQRGEGGDFSLVFVDLDDLKCVNDCHGHAVGDRMILESVKLIKSCIRKSDAICRWGGDEFLIILHTGEAESHRIMEQVQARVLRYNEEERACFALSFSYGIVNAESHRDCCVEELIAYADARMYAYKMRHAKGKNKTLDADKSTTEEHDR